MIKKLMISISVLGIFLCVGTMDYKDELEEHRVYCEMVSKGIWEAYKGPCDDQN